MALISLLDVWKSYDAERPLLEGATFVVRDGDRVGLIGPNGSGKSTLLRLLTGEDTPERGERVARRGLTIGHLEQEPRFDPAASVRAVVRAGMAGREELLSESDELHAALAREDHAAGELERLLARQSTLQARLDELGGHDVEHLVEATIDGVGLADPDALCGTLSGGEARRAALARLLVGTPDLFLLDEPTNHLDVPSAEVLERELDDFDGAVLTVSHDRYFLDRVVDRIVAFEDGGLVDYPGGYTDYERGRAARRPGQTRRPPAGGTT